MTLRSVFFALALALFTLPAWALDLDAARIQGLVGEQADGYVGAVEAAPAAEVLQLVRSVNAQRRAHYEEISRSSGQPLNTVEKLAGAKLIERAGSGQYVKTGGGWTKK